MNDLLVLESGNGAVTNIKKALSRLTEHHKKVSEIKTPKPFVKQKNGYGLCRIFIHERSC